MSRDFASQINRLAAMVPTPRLKPEQIAAVEAGRVLAEEFTEAARAGSLPVDGLMCAMRLLGASGENGDLLMRGFMQDLQKALAEVR